MCHVMKMAKMAKGGCSGAARDEMQQRMKQPWAKVWQEKMQGVGSPGLCEVKAAIEKH
jgi:hypothetical protein